MSRRQRSAISIVAALVILAVLIWLTIAMPPDLSSLPPALLFGLLIVFTATFGVPLAGGRGSLQPMTTVAAYLVMGLVPTAWVAFLGTLVHVWIRYRWAEQLEEQL